jgi:MFS family permease
MSSNPSGKVFYGWYILAGSFFLLFTGIGIAINCQSVLFKPIVQSLGFSRGDFSLFMTIVSLFTMIASPPMGKLLSGCSIRVVMGISTSVATISFLLLSQCTALWQFYVCAAFLGAGLAGTHVIPVSMMITNWFEKKRGLAMGLAFAASGIGGLVFNPATNWLIIHHSWQTAYLVLGCFLGMSTIPVSLFIVRARPQDIGLRPYGHSGRGPGDDRAELDGLTLPEALRTISFWLLGASIFLTGVVCFGIQMHLPAYLTDIGYSPTFAANIVALFLGLMVVGKPVLGAFCDRFGHARGVIYAYAMVFLATLCLFGAQGFWIVLAFALFFGMGNTSQTILPPLLTAGIAGHKSFAVIFAVAHCFLTLGIAVGVPLAGYIFDATGSYTTVWTMNLGLCVLTAACALGALRWARTGTAGRHEAHKR